MATIKELSDGGPDGSRFGQSSSDLVAFWGATPIAQPSGTNQAAVTSTAVTAPSATVATSTNAYGFATSTQADALVTAVIGLTTRVNSLTVWQNVIRQDLVSAGIQKGSV